VPLTLFASLDMLPAIFLHRCTDPSSGVDRVRTKNVLVPERCHPPIHTGRNDHGGGDTVGGGTVRRGGLWLQYPK